MSEKSIEHDKLEAILSQTIEGFKSLTTCTQLTAGASQETFRIEMSTENGEQLLALRRSPLTMRGESIQGQINLKTEAHLLRIAAEAGIPVPGMLYVLQLEDGLGEGYLMEWLEGETLGQRIVRSAQLADVRPHLAHQCGEALARIHTIDVDTTLTQLLPTVSAQELIHESWDAYKALELPEPMIDYTARWLLENVPRQSRNTLVHGDFRNGNLMIHPGGIRAVLDWELAQIGDPLRDLGWLCVNSWRFGKTTLPVGGFGTIEDLLEGYESAAGIEVNRDHLTFWQVFGSFWWSVATLTMAATWRTGETPSLERPVIGRRSSEAQMDCANLIIPGTAHIPDATAMSAGAQLPMPAELIEGVRQFLLEAVAAQQTGRSSFLAKVAANSLGIAQREFLLGATLATAEQQRLALIVGDGNLNEQRWKLVNELREQLALDAPSLAVHLRQTVAGQLAIDQPGYQSVA